MEEIDRIAAEAAERLWDGDAQHIVKHNTAIIKSACDKAKQIGFDQGRFLAETPDKARDRAARDTAADSGQAAETAAQELKHQDLILARNVHKAKRIIKSAIEKALLEAEQDAYDAGYLAACRAPAADAGQAAKLADAIRNLRSIPNGIDNAFAALDEYEQALSHRPHPDAADAEAQDIRNTETPYPTKPAAADAEPCDSPRHGATDSCPRCGKTPKPYAAATCTCDNAAGLHWGKCPLNMKAAATVPEISDSGVVMWPRTAADATQGQEWTPEYVRSLWSDTWAKEPGKRWSAISDAHNAAIAAEREDAEKYRSNCLYWKERAQRLNAEPADMRQPQEDTERLMDQIEGARSCIRKGFYGQADLILKDVQSQARQEKEKK